jgi:hypothetical protein
MSMEQLSNDEYQGKTEELGGIPAPMSLRPSRISLKSHPGLNPGLRGEKPASSHQNYEAANERLI